MSDPLAITDEEAEGLARLAHAQLSLALRLAERAEAHEDADVACRLARASERAARAYRQSLLVKARLRRERDAGLREAAENPPPPSAEEAARRLRRRRELYEAVEGVARETLPDPDDVDFTLDMLDGQIDLLMAEDEAFAGADLALQVARLCEDLGLIDPQAPHPPSGDARGSDPSRQEESSPDSS